MNRRIRFTVAALLVAAAAAAPSGWRLLGHQHHSLAGAPVRVAGGGWTWDGWTWDGCKKKGC